MNRWLVWWRSTAPGEMATEMVGWSVGQILALREARLAILTNENCDELAVIEFPGFVRPNAEVLS